MRFGSGFNRGYDLLKDVVVYGIGLVAVTLNDRRNGFVKFAKIVQVLRLTGESAGCSPVQELRNTDSCVVWRRET